MPASQRFGINPLPPSDAVRQQKVVILEDFFSSVLSQLKKYHPSRNLKFITHFPTLEIAYFNGKILLISFKLNFPPSTLDCYGLRMKIGPQ